MKKPGVGKRRKSVVEVIGYGIADAITGGPIIINTVVPSDKSPTQEKRRASMIGQVLGIGSETPTKRGLSRRRMSLAGALTVEMMKKDQKKKEKEERKAAKKKQTQEVEIMPEAGFSDPIGSGLTGVGVVGGSSPPMELLNKKLSFVKEDTQAETRKSLTEIELARSPSTRSNSSASKKQVTGPQRKAKAMKEKKEKEEKERDSLKGGREEMIAHPQQVSIESEDEEKGGGK